MFIECLPEVLLSVDGAVNKTIQTCPHGTCVFAGEVVVTALLSVPLVCCCLSHSSHWCKWPGSFSSQDQVWILSTLVSPISRSDRLKLLILKVCSGNSHGFQRPFQRGMWAHMCYCDNREEFVFFCLCHECAMELSKIYMICGIKTDWREEQRDDKLSSMKLAITETCKLRKQCHFISLIFWGENIVFIKHLIYVNML